MNVLEATENMYLLIGQHNPRPARILNRELRLTIFPRYPSHRSTQVLAIKLLHILHFVALDLQVVQTEECDGVVEVES